MRTHINARRLSLHISLSRRLAYYEVTCKDRIFVGHVSDPLDFVAEFQDLIDTQRLRFEDCMLELTTEADCVELNYLKANHAMYQKKVCILTTACANLAAHELHSLPVHQHCSSFFGLYLNAVRYLKTIQETA